MCPDSFIYNSEKPELSFCMKEKKHKSKKKKLDVVQSAAAQAGFI